MHTQRIVYIDHLKAALTLLVVAHHAAQAYGPTGGVWVINDPEKAGWLRHFFFINASFMMGLYFFISGYFLISSIRKKSSWQFARDRLKRLGLPLLFFSLLVFLPFNYIASGSREPLLSFFWQSWFEKPPMATGHLWFVASLLVYSFLFFFLFNFRKQNRPARSPAFRSYAVIVYIILLTLVSGLVRLLYSTDEWKTWLIPVEAAHLPQYLSLFLAGAAFHYYNWLEKLDGKTGILFFLAAVVAFILQQTGAERWNSFWLTESLTEAVLCTGICIGLLTFFRRYLSRPHRLWQFLAANAYGIYLVHLFIVIAFQQWLTGWAAPATLKFLSVTLLSVLASVLLSALLRKNRWIRNLI